MDKKIVHISKRCYIDFNKALVFCDNTPKRLNPKQSKFLEKLCSSKMKSFGRPELEMYIYGNVEGKYSTRLTNLKYQITLIDYELAECIEAQNGDGYYFTPIFTDEELGLIDEAQLLEIKTEVVQDELLSVTYSIEISKLISELTKNAEISDKSEKEKINKQINDLKLKRDSLIDIVTNSNNTIKKRY